MEIVVMIAVNVAFYALWYTIGYRDGKNGKWDKS